VGWELKKRKEGITAIRKKGRSVPASYAIAGEKCGGKAAVKDRMEETPQRGINVQIGVGIGKKRGDGGLPVLLTFTHPPLRGGGFPNPWGKNQPKKNLEPPWTKKTDDCPRGKRWGPEKMHTRERRSAIEERAVWERKERPRRESKKLGKGGYSNKPKEGAYRKKMKIGRGREK